MTKEEATERLKMILEEATTDEDAVCYVTSDDADALEMSIKALEQEPILKKIRAEIEQNAYPIVHGVNNHEKGMTLYEILQVIDKYKAESETEQGLSYADQDTLMSAT